MLDIPHIQTTQKELVLGKVNLTFKDVGYTTYSNNAGRTSIMKRQSNKHVRYTTFSNNAERTSFGINVTYNSTTT